jgi:hypothetical protein
MREEEKGEPFVFKMYEIAFVSLFISSLVSMLEIGSQLRINILVFLIGNLSLILPVAFSIVIYYTLYEKRFNLSKKMRQYAKVSIIFTVLVSISYYQEIIPIMMDMKISQDFLTLYSHGTFIHPIAIIALALVFPFMYKEAFNKPYHLALDILLGCVYPQFYAVVTHLGDYVGVEASRKIEALVTFIILILFLMRRKSTAKKPHFSKR